MGLNLVSLVALLLDMTCAGLVRAHLDVGGFGRYGRPAIQIRSRLVPPPLLLPQKNTCEGSHY